jgi:hypothetical protein
MLEMPYNVRLWSLGGPRLLSFAGLLTSCKGVVLVYHLVISAINSLLLLVLCVCEAFLCLCGHLNRLPFISHLLLKVVTAMRDGGISLWERNSSRGIKLVGLKNHHRMVPLLDLRIIHFLRET